MTKSLRQKKLQQASPVLRFSPTAWAKLLFMRDAGDTEVGGFGICSGEDLLLVNDFRLVRQRTTSISVVFEDDAVADFYDEQVDAGRAPKQFGRIWIHTHPGDCPRPSHTDEETFADAFGSSDWSVMFILAQGGASYARLKFNVGPGGSLLLQVHVDYSVAFPGSDHAAWSSEYRACVQPVVPDCLAVLEPEQASASTVYSRRAPPDRWDVRNERAPHDFF